ncbi:YqzE family protein [Pontibacillus yanchengensis]|uniref:YqzE family protein n=1 Tax=Pontibacillus yanchengensis Y32 TaxID=1385514 RepID=A0A0A2TEV3_9BACI|nr:YqzE family protein [Pontibacillus yanchengensis]KGP72948.1 hypothetical protein N782_08540 [Pontibacillus yanchengensis Y32]
MSGNDYVKFMTQELVKYMDMPHEEKQKRKEDKKLHRKPASTQMFGVLPFAIKFLFRRNKGKNRG